MNFVFISPNFPSSYWMFCARLKENGVNVLGIGDCPFDDLAPELKRSLTEYYKVSTLENYGEMVRAMGYFTHRYGKIDWLESNNEYWLEQDAALRTDFNVFTGLRSWDMDPYKKKSRMKEFFQKAGIPCAKFHQVTTLDAAREFIGQVGYPVVVKPDTGVGASNTWKLHNDDELRFFYDHLPEVPYLMEEFVDGVVTTFDGVCNSKGEILFAASHITVDSIMDILNEQRPLYYYVDKDMPDDVREVGTRCVKAFNVRSRCFHIEFFRLKTAREGLGQPGDLVALEVNMRPAGGYTPDMINFAGSADMYKIWADMVAFDHSAVDLDQPHHFCCYVSRRDPVSYRHSDEEIWELYGNTIKISGRMPDALADVMGNFLYIACFDQKEDMLAFVDFVHQEG